MADSDSASVFALLPRLAPEERSSRATTSLPEPKNPNAPAAARTAARSDDALSMTDVEIPVGSIVERAEAIRSSIVSRSVPWKMVIMVRNREEPGFARHEKGLEPGAAASDLALNLQTQVGAATTDPTGNA